MMGSSHGKELIKNYCTQKLSKSQDIRFLKRVFKCYDKKNKGYLNEKQARSFIDDILNISGIKLRIIDKATESGQDPGIAYKDAITQLFKEFDVQQNNRIELKSLLAPRNHHVHNLIEDLQKRLKGLNKLRQSRSQATTSVEKNRKKKGIRFCIEN